MNNEDCIFCKITAGEIPSYNVYETNETLAFLDIHPVVYGHTLVIPKTHATNIFDITPESWADVAESVRIVASAVESALDAHGINIMMNNREHAGQVVDHPHVHIIPRFKGDGLTQWPHGTYQEGEAASVQEKIRIGLK
jgi:histidine triad (HIT) family protein